MCSKKQNIEKFKVDVSLLNTAQQIQLQEKSSSTIKIKKKWTFVYTGQVPEFAFVIHQGKAIFRKYKKFCVDINSPSLICFDSIKNNKKMMYEIILCPNSIISILTKNGIQNFKY